jgi:molybdate transport system substrate-binding protein
VGRLDHRAAARRQVYQPALPNLQSQSRIGDATVTFVIICGGIPHFRHGSVNLQFSLLPASGLLNTYGVKTMHKLTAFVVGLLIVTGASVNAAEIKVLSANGAKLILEALVPQFERETNSKVVISYNEAGILRKRILDGEDFDVTFLPAGWDELRGKVSGQFVAIAHTDFGMAVAASMPKPDTNTNEALKRMLLAAKSIVYTDPKTGGISGVLFVRMIERLGIADEINKKSKVVASQLNASFVVKGEADLAVQLANEILAVPGAQFVPVSPDFQASVTFSGAIAAATKEAAIGKALLQFLTTPKAAPVIRSKGYEPG